MTLFNRRQADAEPPAAPADPTPPAPLNDAEYAAIAERITPMQVRQLVQREQMRDAQARFFTLPPEMYQKSGLAILASTVLVCDKLAINQLDAWLSHKGRRDHAAIVEWMFETARRLGRHAGVHDSLLTSLEQFKSDTLPALAEQNPPVLVETFISGLRGLGRWSA